MLKAKKNDCGDLFLKCRRLMERYPDHADAVGMAAVSAAARILYPELPIPDTPLPQQTADMLHEIFAPIRVLPPDILNFLPEKIRIDAKDAGVFYTPESTANLICRHTLLEFLGNTPENRALIDTVQIPADTALRRKLSNQLAGIKICDPAAGSGVFIRQMLKLLCSIRRQLEPEKSIRDITDSVIRENLYSFDIDPAAAWANVLQLSADAGFMLSEHHIVNADSLTDTPLSWRDRFPEVYMQQGGFDIIIGNPPYIGEKGHKELFAAVKNSPAGRFYRGKMDYFYFFFHQALDQLRDNGCGAFITTSYFATATNAKNLRDDLKKRAALLQLINLDQVKIFDRAPGQHNLITIFRKGSDCNTVCMISRPQLFPEIPSDSIAAVRQSELYEGNWNYLKIMPSVQTENHDILTKLFSDTVKLSSLVRISAGIMGGCDLITKKNIKYTSQEYCRDHDIQIGDGVFVLDSAVLRDAEAIKKLSGQPFFRNFYKNSDIGRYYTVQTAVRHIIFSTPRRSDIEQQIIQKQLNVYRPILKYIRKLNHENTDLWHCLRRGTAHPEIFTGAKIVVPQRSLRNTFAFNECEWFASADVYFMTHPTNGVDLFYLLALLNSRLFYYYFYYCGKRKGSMLEFYSTPLAEVPIKLISPRQQQKFITLARQISAAKSADPAADTSAFEQKLDQYIYDLYALTGQEIAVVESLQNN